jgi:hypothetical protein
VIRLFDSPQTIRKIGVEIEELAVSRTQELSVSVSSDGRGTYRELVRQEFNFSPPGTSFERELWFTSEGAVTPRVDPPNLSCVPLVPFLHVQLRELADSPAGK